KHCVHKFSTIFLYKSIVLLYQNILNLQSDLDFDIINLEVIIMNWTKEQLQAIEIKDKSILVSAAAGSGKTAVLVERIKKLILEDGISLDEMLVVTFTNAAASEMREKIVASIPEQIHNIHKSHISTFHSFALD